MGTLQFITAALPSVGVYSVVVVIIGVLIRLWLKAQTQADRAFARLDGIRKEMADAHKQEIADIRAANREYIGELEAKLDLLEAKIDKLNEALDAERDARRAAEDRRT